METNISNNTDTKADTPFALEKEIKNISIIFSLVANFQLNSYSQQKTFSSNRIKKQNKNNNNKNKKTKEKKKLNEIYNYQKPKHKREKKISQRRKISQSFSQKKRRVTMSICHLSVSLCCCWYCCCWLVGWLFGRLAMNLRMCAYTSLEQKKGCI